MVVVVGGGGGGGVGGESGGDGGGGDNGVSLSPGVRGTPEAFVANTDRKNTQLMLTPNDKGPVSGKTLNGK